MDALVRRGEVATTARSGCPERRHPRLLRGRGQPATLSGEKGELRMVGMLARDAIQREDNQGTVVKEEIEQ